MRKKTPAAFPAFALTAGASFGAQAAGAAPGLRSRSYFGEVGSAQAGRLFSVLTCWKYALRANNGFTFQDEPDNRWPPSGYAKQLAAFPSA